LIVGLDINLSKRLVAALNDIYGSQSLRFLSIGDAADEVWLADFPKYGGTAFIGRDKNILQKPNEVAALDASGLNGFFLNYGNAPAKLHYISAHVIFWWPHIEKLIAHDDENSVYRIPPHMRGWTEVEALRINASVSPPRVSRHTT
jgi:hypothetical protein